MSEGLDARTYRQVMSHYPTGVCAITSVLDGRPVGMIVGSFTSVSLEPPLVAFFPDRLSTSWPRIKATGRFCVNVLSEHQQDVCKALAAREEDKFVGIAHRLSGEGLPVLDEVVAWIECEVHSVHEAGDHFIVVGEVHSLNLERAGAPLVFHRGAYGGFRASNVE